MKAWLATVLCLFVAGCGGGAKLDYFLYVPERVDHYVLQAQGSTPEETVAPEQIEPVQITTEDGVLLGAAYVKATVQPPRGYVIFFHGKGGDLDSSLPRLKRYANLGYDTLGFDYRGFGTSSNVPIDEAGINLDGRAVVRYMSQRIGGMDRLFYAGQSFGCAPAAQQAMEQPARALFIESGFASLDELQKESSQMDFPQQYITKDHWATYERLRSIYIPVLILHGTADDLIRPTHAQINYDNANEPKKLVIVPGGGHSNLPNVMGAQYADLVHSYMDATFSSP